ncbi:hypothetical protein [Terriglobus aquaticus]|uniref:Urocanase Rossmann-like domain-containing protein n=1 Tax=Terriglobus aquaticus TaxID=940139 RepID=A0ABW9KI91_9BACT|nr:hypothetical protein [Terriglobus aquaticus]
MDRSENTLQRRSLAAFLSLMQRHDTWSGRLVLLSASDEAAAFAMAVLATGGAVLWVCADETSLRESGLQGLSDFQVTTLGEALRILKNEIRKGLPVSVAVLDAAGTVWGEAAARGVQPDAVWPGDKDAEAGGVLIERGAERLVVADADGILARTAQTWRELRAIDAELLEQLSGCALAERMAGERWLRAASRLFPGEMHRCYAAAWTASKDSR